MCEPSPAAVTVGQGPSQSLVTDSKHPAAHTSPQRSCNDIAATASSNELQQLASGPGAHPHLDLFFLLLLLRLPLRSSGLLQVGGGQGARARQLSQSQAVEPITSCKG